MVVARLQPFRAAASASGIVPRVRWTHTHYRPGTGLQAVSSPSFMAGFRTLDEEVTDRSLPVEGGLPDWLSGTLLRNGPGAFEVGGERVGHWFDGLAMLRRYHLDGGEIRYSNRFLRTDAYADAQAGRLTGQFGTDAGVLRTLRDWLANLGPPAATDNANVHVARMGGGPVALTEVPRWVGFEATSLEARGEVTFADDLSLDMTTAHLRVDPRTDALVGFGLTFGRTHEYVVYRIPRDGADGAAPRRKVLARIPADPPAYIHDCGLTADQVVLVETPLRISVLRALSPFSEGFQDILDWQPERDTRFLVVDRATGDVTTWTAPPVFTFHVANAFADAGDVVVDLVAFADDGIVEGLSFESLADAAFEDVPPGYLVRYRLGGDGVTRTRLHDGGMELPVVAASARTREHRYVYAQATGRSGANGLVKVDTRTGGATTWWEDDLYLEEPRVVERPDASAEDAGVVLVPAIDANGDHSLLLVLDAADLSERARAHLPHQHPFGFHGRFFPA